MEGEVSGKFWRPPPPSETIRIYGLLLSITPLVERLFQCCLLSSSTSNPFIWRNVPWILHMKVKSHHAFMTCIYLNDRLFSDSIYYKQRHAKLEKPIILLKLILQITININQCNQVISNCANKFVFIDVVLSWMK